MSDKDNFEFESEDFESMLEESLNKRDNFETGELVEGVVIGINNECIFFDISGKSEAIIPIEEFFDKDGELNVKKGDKIKAFVVAYDRGEILLTTEIGKGNTNTQLLEYAFNNHIPVSGLVTDEINGGFSITVGTTSCFCPYSQMDIRRISSGEEFLNKHFQFEIIDMKDYGRNIVLSRRALLEEKQKEVIESLKEKISVGEEIESTVTRIADFGLFTDIGGVNALIPRSELGWSRFETPDSFKIGQKVKAKIISIDWSSNKIALSIKQTLNDPSSNITKYNNGDKLEGKVSNIIKNGVFIEIEPGLDGFIPLSRLSYTKRVLNPEEIVSVGENVDVKIVEIDLNKNRIGLELISGDKNPWDNIESGLENKIENATIEFVKPVGLTIRLENGMEGFIPSRELIKKDELLNWYHIGDKINVIIIEFNKNNKRLIASEKLVSDIEEKKEFNKYMNKDSDNSSTENSSLGSRFKDVFSDLQKKIK